MPTFLFILGFVAIVALGGILGYYQWKVENDRRIALATAWKDDR